MSEIQLFDVGDQPWRFGVADDGRPYVVAEDFTPALDYSRARDALRMVDDDEKGAQIVRTPGGDQRMSVLYEDGIWELIFLSRKPEARAIKQRVKEILRQIRETGSYLPERQVPQSYAAALRAAADAEEAKERLAAELTEARPKADSWDVLASGDGDFSVADAAKILSRDPAISVGRDRLFEHMDADGWLYRQPSDGRRRAYQTQVDAGRLSELPQTYENAQSGRLALAAPQVRVTHKGLHELHRRLGGIRQLQIPAGGAA